MIIENTAALQFLITEDIYLAKKDVDNLNRAVAVTPVAAAPELPVEVKEVAIVVEPTVVNFNYLGNNQKQFLILCHYPELDSMDDKHLDALKSALQRKILSLDDVAIVNLAKHSNATADELQDYFKPERLLLLGAQCLLSGWDTCGLNQLADIKASKVLYSYSFTEMMGDRDKTKAFWEQMKVL